MLKKEPSQAYQLTFESLHSGNGTNWSAQRLGLDELADLNMIVYMLIHVQII